jgi:hypothetical protein
MSAKRIGKLGAWGASIGIVLCFVPEALILIGAGGALAGELKALDAAVGFWIIAGSAALLAVFGLLIWRRKRIAGRGRADP